MLPVGVGNVKGNAARVSPRVVREIEDAPKMRPDGTVRMTRGWEHVKRFREHGVIPTIDQYNKALRDAGRYSHEGYRIPEIMRWMEEDGVKKNGVTFNILVKQELAAGRWEGAAQALSAMEKAGFPADEYSHATYLRHIFKLRDGKGADDYYTVLPDHVKYHPVVQRTMLAGYATQNDEIKAMAFFNRLRGFNVADNIDCNVVMSMFLRRDKVDEVKAVFEWMKSKGVMPTAATRHQLQTANRALADHPDVVAMVKSLGAFERTAIEATDEIHQAGKQGDMEKMLQLYADMKHEGIRPFHETFRAMVVHLLRAGLFDEVARLFQDMLAMRFKPPPDLVDMVVQAQLKAGLKDSATLLRHEFGSKATYAARRSTQFRALVKEGGDIARERALYFFERILEREHHEIDVGLFTTAASAGVRLGVPRLTEVALQEMSRRNVSPSLELYTSLGHALMDTGRRHLVGAVLDAMQYQGIAHDSVSRQLLLDTCSEVSEAELVFEAAKAEGTLDFRVFTSMVNFYARFDRTDDLRRLKAEMPHLDVRIDKEVREKVASGDADAQRAAVAAISASEKVSSVTVMQLLKDGDLNRAIDVASQILGPDKGRLDAASLGWLLVRMSDTRSDPARIVQLLRDGVARDGNWPELRHLTIVIKNLFRFGGQDACAEIWKMMRNDPQSPAPDEHFLNVMARKSIRHGREDAAEDVAQQMADVGAPVHLETQTAFVNAHIQRGDRFGAQQALRKFLDASRPTDKEAFHAVLSLPVVRQNRLSNVVWEYMRDADIVPEPEVAGLLMSHLGGNFEAASELYRATTDPLPEFATQYGMHALRARRFGVALRVASSLADRNVQPQELVGALLGDARWAARGEHEEALMLAQRLGVQLTDVHFERADGPSLAHQTSTAETVAFYKRLLSAGKATEVVTRAARLMRLRLISYNHFADTFDAVLGGGLVEEAVSLKAVLVETGGQLDPMRLRVLIRRAHAALPDVAATLFREYKERGYARDNETIDAFLQRQAQFLSPEKELAAAMQPGQLDRGEGRATATAVLERLRMEGVRPAAAAYQPAVTALVGANMPAAAALLKEIGYESQPKRLSARDLEKLFVAFHDTHKETTAMSESTEKAETVVVVHHVAPEATMDEIRGFFERTGRLIDIQRRSIREIVLTYESKEAARKMWDLLHTNIVFKGHKQPIQPIKLTTVLAQRLRVNLLALTRHAQEMDFGQFHRLLHACRLANDFQEMLRLFDSMPADGRKRTTAVFNEMLKASSPRSAVKFLLMMEVEGVVPNYITARNSAVPLSKIGSEPEAARALAYLAKHGQMDELKDRLTQRGLDPASLVAPDAAGPLHPVIHSPGTTPKPGRSGVAADASGGRSRFTTAPQEDRDYSGKAKTAHEVASLDEHTVKKRNERTVATLISAKRFAEAKELYLHAQHAPAAMFVLPIIASDVATGNYAEAIKFLRSTSRPVASTILRLQRVLAEQHLLDATVPFFECLPRLAPELDAGFYAALASGFRETYDQGKVAPVLGAFLASTTLVGHSVDALRALFAVLQGRNEEAANIFRKLGETRSTVPRYRIGAEVAFALRRAGCEDLARAVEAVYTAHGVVVPALSLSPNEKQVQQARTRVHKKKTDASSSAALEELYNAKVSSGTVDTRLQNTVAFGYAMAGNADDAVRFLTAASGPKLSAALMRLHASLLQKDELLAITFMAMLPARVPSLGPAFYATVASRYRELGKPSHVVPLLEAFLLTGVSPDGRVLALLNALRGNFAALETAEPFPKQATSTKRFEKELAYSLHAAGRTDLMQRFGVELTAPKEARNSGSGTETPKKTHAARRQLRGLLRDGRIEEAERLFSSAAAKTPTIRYMVTEIAEAWVMKGQDARMMEFVRKVTPEGSSVATILLPLREKMHARGGGVAQRAHELMVAMPELAPELDASFYAGLVEAYGPLAERAIQLLTAYVKIGKPDAVPVHVLLLLLSGQLKEADDLAKRMKTVALGLPARRVLVKEFLAVGMRERAEKIDKNLAAQLAESGVLPSSIAGLIGMLSTVPDMPKPRGD